MTIINDIEKQLRRRLSELGQGGIHHLGAHESAWEAFLADPSEANKAAVTETLIALHTYGATAYIELGLKLKTAETFTGAAGEVQTLSGGTGKQKDPVGGG